MAPSANIAMVEIGRTSFGMDASSPDRLVQRDPFLDAARGVAAILVVLHHAYHAAPFWPDLVRFSPLRLLLTGRPSVLFFYVLSGYVLAYALWTSPRTGGVTLYAAKRFVRIYLPYLAATVAASALYWLVQGQDAPAVGTNAGAMWSLPISWQIFGQHLLLAGTPAANSLNTPAWSLVYEIRISLFMPLLCALYAKAPRRIVWAATTVFIIMSAALSMAGIGATPYYADTFAINAVLTVYFVTLFVFGMSLAHNRLSHDRLGDVSWMNHARRTRVGLLIVACCLILVNRDIAIVPGVVILLYLGVSRARAISVLDHPVLLFLGRISFSLYLTHMVVIETILRQTAGTVPSTISVPVSIVLAIAVAWGFYRVIERPAHRVSQRLGLRQAARHRRLRSARLELAGVLRRGGTS